MERGSIMLEREIAAYEKVQTELEREHRFKWVVFHGDDLIGVFPDLQEAAEEAVSRFGRGPYLIRQVAAPALTLPISLRHRTM
jgi:hypothetical protein